MLKELPAEDVPNATGDIASDVEDFEKISNANCAAVALGSRRVTGAPSIDEDIALRAVSRATYRGK